MTPLLIVGIVFAFWWFFRSNHPRNFPPAPKFRLPIFGNALEIGSNLPEGFEALRRKYGDIFGCFIGKERAVVLSDLDLIQEAGSQLVFANRMHLPVLVELRGGYIKSGNALSVAGVGGTNGPNWMEQRRFTIQALKDLGYGKNTMEDIVCSEVKEFSSWVQSLQEKPMDIRSNIQVAIMNTLWTIVSSKRMEYSEPKTQSLVHLLNLFLNELASPATSALFMIKPLYQLVKPFYDMDSPKAIKQLMAEMASVLEEHEKTYQEEDARDFIDHYITAMRDPSSKYESCKGNTGKLNLLGTLMDFFVGGGEGTSKTLSWGMLYMLENPDVQEKVRAELDSVTGRRRLPNLGDRESTPYTEAVIHELQRIANVTPLSLTHAAAEDAYLGKYFIPKGTWIFHNIGSIHMDPETFPNPSKFDPTRFISKDGLFQPHPKVLPFGVGRRRCIGENLGKMALYLFFTGMISTFNLAKANEDDKVPINVRVPGLTIAPKSYEMRFIPRD